VTDDIPLILLHPNDNILIAAADVLFGLAAGAYLVALAVIQILTPNLKRVDTL
jgi:hypothetical protein